MDWDRVMINKARTGCYVGRGADDEDAYYRAFAGDEIDGIARLLVTARSAVTVIGVIALSAVFVR